MGWLGFAGLETEVYLVFDPERSLATEIKSHHQEIRGIPSRYIVFTAWKAIITPFCFTPILVGTIALFDVKAI